jgi:hypothetical protein
LAAISRLPTRVTLTGSRFSARILRTRSSLKKGSTSSETTPVSSGALAMASSATAAFCPRRAKNSAAPNPASSARVRKTLPVLDMS